MYIKLKFFIFALLFTTNVFSQTIGPKIPWAQIQADWTFPIYFEDALGARDTFYLFNDSTIINNPDLDTLYGLNSLGSLDSNNMFTCFESDYAYANNGNPIYKSVWEPSGIYRSVKFLNYTLPLKVQWDTMLFKTQPLFGSDISFAYICNYDNPCIDDNFSGAIFMLDKQSITISDVGVFTFPITIYMNFSEPTGNKKIYNSNVRNNINIKENEISFTEHISNYKIYSIWGNVLKIENSNNSLKTDNLPKGIYIVKAFLNTNYYETKRFTVH